MSSSGGSPAPPPRPLGRPRHRPRAPPPPPRAEAPPRLPDEDDDDDEDDEGSLFDPGRVVPNGAGDAHYRVEDLIGEGRCCSVYSAHSVLDPSHPVALKVYRQGRAYEGALQREQFMLHMFRERGNNVVTQYEYFPYRGLHVQAMELLECNVRQVIFRNDRSGVSAWVLQRFARDVLTALAAMHRAQYVHADLKPANIMWSSGEGRFKVLDFGLTFHTEEADLHQVQTKGYQAPEAAEWNAHKDDQRKRRRKRLQGTYCDLRQIPPAYKDRLNQVGSDASSLDHKEAGAGKTAAVAANTPQQPSVTTGVAAGAERWPSESSGVFTASEISQCTSPVNVPTSTTTTTMASSSSFCYGGDVTPVHSSGSVTNGSTQRRRHSVICTPAVQTQLRDALGGGSGSSGQGLGLVPAAEQLLRTPSGASRDSTTTTCSSSSRCSESPASFLRPPSEAGSEHADWRRGRKHRRSNSLAPALPGAPIDLWSLGCLLFELLTGSKLFRAGDKLASVLRPLQLVDMRIGEAEIRFGEQGQAQVFAEAKDLIRRCLEEDPGERITAAEALEHAFVTRPDLKPSVRDMVLLPSNVLMLVDLLREEITDEEERKDFLLELRSEAAKFGSVSSCRHDRGHVYLEFAEASAAQRASAALKGRTLDGRTVVPVFYPVERWVKNVLY